jgi:prepilin-type processing-associated H-X9-DG protein
MPQRLRGGFTPLEITIVLAVLALLAGLLLPAVQMVRAQATRTVCLNNLKQIGLAFQTYHADNQRLPPSVLQRFGFHAPPFYNLTFPPLCAPFNNDSLYGSYWSWGVFLLPYLDEGDLFRQARFLKRPWNQPISSYSIKTYRCPADQRAESNFTNGYNVALTDYLGVNGTDQFTFDGICAVNRTLTFDQILDGTSNTIMIGERPPSSTGWWGWWAGGMGDWPFMGTCDVILGVAERQYMPNDPFGNPSVPESFRPGALDDPEDGHRWHFWSLHPNGAHFLFADGSVKFIRYESRDILKSLATYNGGEIISER